MRNINDTLNNVGNGTTAPPADRTGLESELLAELTAWPPGDRSGVFKAWHRHGLSLVHLNVLSAIEAEGPLTMKQLAEVMDVSDAGVTGIVDRMEKRGLVDRRHGTEDRRQVLVYPTEAGAQVFRDMAEHRSTIMNRVLGELSADEMRALLVGMRAIHAARRRVLTSMGRNLAGDGPCAAELAKNQETTSE